MTTRRSPSTALTTASSTTPSGTPTSAGQGSSTPATPSASPRNGMSAMSGTSREVPDDSRDRAEEREHRRLEHRERRHHRGRGPEQAEGREPVVAASGGEPRRRAAERGERHHEQHEGDHGERLVGHRVVVGPGPERLGAADHREQQRGHDRERGHGQCARRGAHRSGAGEQPRDPGDHAGTRSPTTRPSRMSTMREQRLATSASCVTSDERAALAGGRVEQRPHDVGRGGASRARRSARRRRRRTPR